MMRSISVISVPKPNIHQNLHLKAEQQSDYNTLTNTVSKVNLSVDSLSHRPPQMSSSERTKGTNPIFPSLKIKDELQTTHKAQLREAVEGQAAETVRHSSHEGAEMVVNVTQMLAPKAHVSTTVSSTSSITLGTEQSTASQQSFSTSHTPVITAVTKTQEPRETSSSTLSNSTSISPPATFSTLDSSNPSMKTHLPHVTPPSNTSNTTGHHNLMMNTTSTPPLLSRSLLRRPVCLYPPVPAHGSFYFRNVGNPGPREFRHYIQYACYPGYTLARGDIHSYCQQDGTWSGVTPVCLGRWLLLLHAFLDS